ncbi:hypothetical protein PACTADRAFT_40552 [Pachysolen tannophilus NRRL Y-2460]|uniref:ATP-dependent RNA helicase n=1 Tax=Pachysolen tannophilus NRRL Y-2460 TaxID=669874 RepID=A0A1E4TW72_PACTA|nr:hypothetical protein PACTADRAFT_40552 [Pachysolen tannophilus NRRL Y-2460]
MFAARFDPSQVYDSASGAASGDGVVRGKTDFIKKRKLSISSEDEQESEQESSDGSSQDESDNGSSSEESSDESSVGSSESASEVEVENENENDEDSMDVDNDGDDDSTVAPKKHTSIMHRFQKSTSKSRATGKGESEESEEEDNNGEIVPLNDIKPLPQPSLPHDKKLSSLSAANRNLDWLTKPIFYDIQNTKPFKDLQPSINPLIIKNLEVYLKTNNAFSVQIACIELLLKDLNKNKISPSFQGDLLCNASTGSGKTLAYLVPILQLLHDIKITGKLIAIILVPTRPLIQQLLTTINLLLKNFKRNINIVSFKNDGSIREEAEKLKSNKPDIIISTPGRLVEHLGNLNLANLRFLVIDEADRLLNQSFQNWCDLLINKIEKEQNLINFKIYNKFQLKVQKLIFSATLTTDSGKLSHLNLQKPRLIVVNNEKTLVNELYQLPLNLKECYIRFNSGLEFYKPLILLKFLLDYTNFDNFGLKFNFNNNILIFVKSNENSLRLTRLLEIMNQNLNEGKKLIIKSINSNLSILERSKILKNFEENKINILVSTDLISRGINLLNIKTVLNYDLPVSSKEYIHRVGRTSRANNFGFTINFIFGLGEWKWLSKTCLFNNQINRNETETEPGFELDLTDMEKQIYENSLKELENEVYNSGK